MIKIEKLKQVTNIYVHGKCPDGLASAMILKDAFKMLGMTPQIEFIVHGTPEHKNAGIESVCPLFCDIAPSEYARQYVSSRGGIVLDHHKGTEELVKTFGELGVFADEKLEPGVSGAVLAFKHVFSPIFDFTFDNKLIQETSIHKFNLTRNFAMCIGARDTWNTTSPNFQRGQYITKMLMSKSTASWLSDVHDHSPYCTESEIEIGKALFESHEESIRQAVQQLVRFGFSRGDDDCMLYVFQEQATGFRLCSDVAEAISTQMPTIGVAAGFSYVIDKPGDSPHLLFSLRGLGGFDVGTFAKSFGGGGHTAAAGFSVSLDGGKCINPYEFIAESLRSFV